MGKETKTESEIQKEITDYLKSIGCLVFRMNSGKTQHNVTLCPNGTPDLLVITKTGYTIWIEVKTETGKLRVSQVEMIANLHERKQDICIARSVESVVERFKYIIK